MRVSDLLTGKGASVRTIAPTALVTDLLAVLAENNIGAVVVAEDGRLAGIVSERDVVRRLHDTGTEILDGPVSDVMTTLVATCRASDAVETLTVLMTERRIRHVPVIDGAGMLIGIISIGDVVKSRIDQLEVDRQQLEAYIAQ